MPLESFGELGPIVVGLAGIALLCLLYLLGSRRPAVRLTASALVVGSQTVAWDRIEAQAVWEKSRRTWFRLDRKDASAIVFHAGQVKDSHGALHTADSIAARAHLFRAPGMDASSGGRLWVPRGEDGRLVAAGAEEADVAEPVAAGPSAASPKAWLARAGAVGAVLYGLWKLKFILLLVLSKLKWIFVLLKLSKVLVTAGSMVLMIGAYAWMFGLAFAAAFVGLILIHELGHAWMIRRMGLRAGWPVFIPFLGAFITMKDQPKDARIESWIGYAGPLAGTLATLGAYAAWRVTGDGFWAALSYTGFFLNLFNLIPVSPLDGGRVVAALSPRIWLFGLPLVIALFFATMNPLLAILAVLGGITAWRVWRSQDPSVAEYYSVAPRTRLAVGAAYLSLCLFLGAMVMHTMSIAPRPGA